MTSVDISCNEAEGFASSPTLTFLLPIKCITSLLAAIATLILIFCKTWRWLVHPNAQILFALHLCFALLLPASYTFVYAWDYSRVRGGFGNPCDYRVKASWALNTRYVPVVGLMGEMLSMLALAIERAISTYYKGHYEKNKSILIGLVGSLVTIFLSLAIPYFCLIFKEDQDAMFTTYTMMTPTNRLRFQVMLHAETAIEVATFVIFILAFVTNYKSKEQRELSSKYQVKENLSVIKLLFPIFVFHFFFLILNSFGLELATIFLHGIDIHTHKLVLEWVGQVHLYSLVMPICVFSLRKLSKQKNTQRTHNLETATANYFRDLSHQWNNVNPNRNR